MADRRDRPHGSQRRQIHLGPAFADPGSILRSKPNARRFFLEVVTERHPEFFNELTDLVDVFRAASEANGGLLREEDVSEIVDDEDYELRQESASLRTALRGWAIRWQVAEPWVMEFAMVVLVARAEKLALGTWLSPLRGGGKTAGPGAAFEFEGWDPGREWWDTWKRRLERTLKRFLQGYRERNEQRARDLGMVPNDRRLAEHFDWLVRFQVGGEDFAPIARDAGKSRNAVSIAVHSVADFIGLRLRAQRMGRPPKL